MLVKTESLHGLQLDWAVANVLGYECDLNMQADPDGEMYVHDVLLKATMEPYHPTTDWSVGGFIIERFNINLLYTEENTPWYAITNLPYKTVKIYGKSAKPRGEAYKVNPTKGVYANTPLMAAMILLVRSHYPDEINIPAEFNKNSSGLFKSMKTNLNGINYYSHPDKDNECIGCVAKCGNEKCHDLPGCYGLVWKETKYTES